MSCSSRVDRKTGLGEGAHETTRATGVIQVHMRQSDPIDGIRR